MFTRKVYLLLISLLSGNVTAEGLEFALIAKNTSDENFIEVWRGCEAAAQRIRIIVYCLAPEQEASARLQSQAIERCYLAILPCLGHIGD